MRAALILACGIALAQTGTSIKPDQLRTSTEMPTHLWAGSPFSGLVFVKIGPGVKITKDASGFTIDVAPASHPKFKVVLVQSVLPRAADGTYPAASPLDAIYRNGLRMEFGSDYAVVNGRIIPAAAFPWAPDDKITADSWRLEYE